MFSRKISVKNLSINIYPHSQDNDKAFLHYDLGTIVRRKENGKEYDDEIIKMTVDEKRMAAEVHFSYGSKVIYKGYRFIYTL